MGLSILATIAFGFLFAAGTLQAEDGVRAPAVEVAVDKAIALEQVAGWLKQFENTQEGNLPETFCVKIAFEGYMSQETAEGTHFYRPREVYEFTPNEVRRLCLRAAGVDDEGETQYRVDNNGRLVYDVADTKPFKKIDQICRILLALDFLELADLDPTTGGRNFHHLQVMTDSGLRPLGGASIHVTAAGAELSYSESCLFAGPGDSSHSIRFAALYHTLRRLARTEFGLTADDWWDALDIIDADGVVKPATGEFRARD